MKARYVCGGVALILAAAIANAANAQLASPCVKNSPERQGKIGCSIIEDKVLPSGLQGPLFWHIDSFDSVELARAAGGPTAVAFEAAGQSWLFTIESQTSNHHGGKHVTEVGPLPLSPAPQYSMEVRSALFKPGMYSAAHYHSGVEAVYVIEGDACYETPTKASRARKGETVVISAGTFHRAVAAGSTTRYVLSVNLHDSSKTPTVRMEEVKVPQLVKCK
jgi:quercetin dioxygenase-like cupin family protein